MNNKVGKARITRAQLKVLQQIMFEGGRDGYSWVFKGVNLKRSVDALLKKGEAIKPSKKILRSPASARIFAVMPNAFHISAFLLLGLAVENMLKGTLVALDPSLATGRLNKKLATHDIQRLLSQIPPKFRPKCKPRIAKCLQANVEWVSKYPMPKKCAAMEGGLDRTNFKDAVAFYDSAMKCFWEAMVDVNPKSVAEMLMLGTASRRSRA